MESTHHLNQPCSSWSWDLHIELMHHTCNMYPGFGAEEQVLNHFCHPVSPSNPTAVIWFLRFFYFQCFWEWPELHYEENCILNLPTAGEWDGSNASIFRSLSLDLRVGYGAYQVNICPVCESQQESTEVAIMRVIPGANICLVHTNSVYFIVSKE